jgi:hypothetical protein
MSEQDINPKKRQEATKAVTDKIQDTAAQLHKIYEPQWSARADSLKTIISLSSGSIVLSVTFSSSLRALNIDPAWRYLIVFSFSLFVMSLVLAFIALRIGTRLYEIQSNMFVRRKEVRRALVEAPSEEDFYNTFDSILRDALTPVERNDKRASKLFRASTVCFCSAIIFLAVAGVVQLLT